jgi:hypothetical protein
MAIRFGRKTPENWKEEVLLPERLADATRGRPTRVMFPSTHDVSPANVEFCIEALKRMLGHGHHVTIVTKPRLECILALLPHLSQFKAQVLFLLSIGSSESDVLSYWEPNAPALDERLTCLSMVFHAGYATSVSCEPMLDVNPVSLVKRVCPHVTETIWIGFMNMAGQRLKINGAPQSMIDTAYELLEAQKSGFVDNVYWPLSSKYRRVVRWKDSARRFIGEEIGRQVDSGREHFSTVYQASDIFPGSIGVTPGGLICGWSESCLYRYRCASAARCALEEPVV